MKLRFLFLVLSVFALLIVAIFVSADHANSQEPVAAQPSQTVSDAQPQAPAAPTSLLFSYQGKLLNASGDPITNSAVPMVFRLYTASSGDTPCWSESRTVDVRNGLFHVLLGQITAINNACLTGDAYLELVVNGETLTPRERLTSVAHAAEASYLANGAIARGAFDVAGNLRSFGSISAQNANNVTAAVNLSWLNDVARIRIGGDGVGTRNGLDIQAVGNRSLMRILDDGSVKSAGNLTVGGYNFYLRGDGNGNVALRDGGGERILHLLPWGGSGSAWDKVCIGCGSGADLMISGNLDLRGSCTVASNSLDGSDAVSVVDEDCVTGSIISGAYVEANLMRPEERKADGIERFQRGDLLCWSGTKEQLELCNTANDRLVMAVADPNGRPIVIGAEPVKVLGPVAAGDILVSSDVAGYAMVNNDPKPGTVIGQALESLGAEMGLIKAMVRKW